jgi:hypothetical protein
MSVKNFRANFVNFKRQKYLSSIGSVFICPLSIRSYQAATSYQRSRSTPQRDSHLDPSRKAYFKTQVLVLYLSGFFLASSVFPRFYYRTFFKLAISTVQGRQRSLTKLVFAHFHPNLERNNLQHHIAQHHL